MISTKVMAAAAATALVAQPGGAAVRPSAAQLSPATVSQMAAGTRMGTKTRRKRSDILLIVLGITAAGAGVAAATGAHGGGGKSTSP